MAQEQSDAQEKADRPHEIRAVDDAPADTRRGGDVRTLLSPKTAQSTSGFMGVATIPSGDKISEHYHPYSEEFLFLVRGRVEVSVDGETVELGPNEGLIARLG